MVISLLGYILLLGILAVAVLFAVDRGIKAGDKGGDEDISGGYSSPVSGLPAW